MTRRSSVLGTALWVCVAVIAPGETGAQEAGRPAIAPNPLALTAKLDAYLASAAGTLDPRAREVLRRIPNRSRRMLAVAHYLQRRHLVDERWPWSGPQSRAYQKTDEYRQRMQEIRRVKRTFDSLNPGYRLVAGTGGRSLTTQIAYWNREGSVAAAAREILESCRARLADTTLPVTPDSAGLALFLDDLMTYRTARPPTVAVPGLSMHGRFRAIDLAIMHGRRIVASTTSASIESVWDSGGWTERLSEAVTRARGTFSGPLEEPREPWHYEYQTWTAVAR
jgi:hypothetical protein